MEIRKGTMSDLPEMLVIYEQARQFMREQGNGGQWGDHWPPEELIREDIQEGRSYVCVEEETVIACFCFFVGEDPAYTGAIDGAWPDQRPYSVVHRIATRRDVRGAGQFCLDWAYQQHAPLRIDTHRNNKAMQSLLRKCGFQFCGVVYIREDHMERDAFIKI